MEQLFASYLRSDHVQDASRRIKGLGFDVLQQGGKQEAHLDTLLKEPGDEHGQGLCWCWEDLLHDDGLVLHRLNDGFVQGSQGAQGSDGAAGVCHRRCPLPQR